MSYTVEPVVPEGDLDHSRARRLFDVDVGAGFTLLCTARPRSDCRTGVDAYREMLEHRAAHDESPDNAKLHD